MGLKIVGIETESVLGRPEAKLEFTKAETRDAILG